MPKPCECCDHPLEHLVSQALDEASWLGPAKALENLRSGFEDWRADPPLPPRPDPYKTLVKMYGEDAVARTLARLVANVQGKPLATGGQSE